MQATIHMYVCVCVCVCLCVCVCVCVYALHVYTYTNTRDQFYLLVHASALAVRHITSALTVSALLLFSIQAPPISERSSEEYLTERMQIDIFPRL
jgi:hypothetical protein